MSDSPTNPIGAEVETLLKRLVLTADGLIPAIAQQHDTGEVLMMAWMTPESLRESLETGRVVYWSRSRKQLWRKGDTSGQIQKLIEARIDCDQDCLLLLVDQIGVACHTGRRSCFYTALRNGKPEIISEIEIAPDKLYGA
ncbi:MAG TPA: phosphoribosyl-AMP cyclohydrolase [Terriglobales bacterium]|nr:phosphoribosyl-AMP cyclohydrolase [Terriglobales bacterium]